MRAPLVSLLALALCLGCACRRAPAVDGTDAALADLDADASLPRARLRIATVNLHCLIDGWSERLPLLVSELAEVAPDVMAFEEVCRDEGGADSLAELMSALTAATGIDYHTARADTHPAWDQYQEGIALASRFPLQDEEVVDLPVGIFPRRSVMARIDNPIMPLQMAVTHLSFGDQADIRAQQLHAVRTAIERRQEDEDRAIIAGDLNEGPQGQAVSAALAAGYIDSWALRHPNNDGPTYPADAPSKRIDYLLLSPDASVDALAVERFMTQATDGIRPSDHIAVWVDVAP